MAPALLLGVEASMSLPELITTLQTDHAEREALSAALAAWTEALAARTGLDVSELAARHELDYVLPAFTHDWSIQ